MKRSAPALSVDALAAGVRNGDRRALAKAITLVESTRADQNRRKAGRRRMEPGVPGVASRGEGELMR